MGLQCRWSTSSGCCLILAEMESRICTPMYSSGSLPISSGTITWNIHKVEPTTCIKFINLYKKSRHSLRQQICRKVLFTSIQSDTDQNQEWLGCVGKKWWDKFEITSFLLALSGWAISFDFRSHLVNEAIMVFGLIWLIQHPLTAKRLRVELNATHITKSTLLTVLLPSKLTTQRHYRLLQTRSWSYKQSVDSWGKSIRSIGYVCEQ